MFRFTIRDVLWLTVLVAVLVAWCVDRAKTRIDWERVRNNERALQASKKELYLAQMQAKTAREQKEGILRAAARFGISPFSIEPETNINRSLLGDRDEE